MSCSVEIMIAFGALPKNRGGLVDRDYRTGLLMLRQSYTKEEY